MREALRSNGIRADRAGTDLDRYERRLRARGFRLIAGADEAGRGALAGPLFAAAVILPEGFDLQGINDSKVLTALQRERAFERIRSGAVAVSVCRVMPTRIDHRGLHRSNLFLLRRVFRELPVPPDFVLSDGFPLRGLRVPHLSIKKGDAVTASVAAASIVAKVTRDRMMDRYHRRFPEYGFDTNRGYGTAAHWRALERVGPCPIHRRSFKGVAALAAAHGFGQELGPDGDSVATPIMEWP
ncbi:MAG: ribonuclease HII [Actinomycetota bacterium]|nr:ribonuclease HII [Actinomycetota bacterium]